MSLAGQRYIWGPAWETYYCQFWDKPQIINSIRSLAARRKAINLASLVGAGEWRLIRAASYYFGSWRAAVEAAGFNYEEVRADIKWTPDKVVSIIRRLHRKKADLSSRAVQLRQPALFAGAVRKRTFGSWEKAIDASGLSYGAIRKYEQWSVNRLASEIAVLEKNGVRLNAAGVLRANPRLYYAACRRYGAWSKTLRALGFDYTRHALRRPWTKKEILDGLRALVAQGVRISDSNMRHEHLALYTAACRKWGSWTRARAKLGIRWERRRGGNTSFLPGFEPPSMTFPARSKTRRSARTSTSVKTLAGVPR